MKYLIREVDVNEWVNVIHDLDRACFPDDKPWEQYPEERAWLAFSEDRSPVGFGLMVPSYEFHRCGFYTRSAVSPEARGSKLQKRLIRAREKAALKVGWDLVYTYTSPDNPASANNLNECGYTIFVPPRRHSGQVYWMKLLKKETS